MTTPDQGHAPYGQETPPTCYRHPDRETWVSCVRCGRHACPDCLRSAAVGQQCVDCVHEGSRTTRRPTTVFGGRPARTAVVTWTLIAVNVAAVPGRAGQAVHRQRLGAARVRAVRHGRAAAGHRRRPVVPADHVRVPAAGTGLGGLGFLDIAVQHVGAVRGRAEPGAAARPGPLPRGLPAQRARRRCRVLPHRPEHRARARRQRRDLRPVRRLVRGVQAAAARQPRDPGADRDQPGVQLHLPLHDRLAGSRRRADRGRAGHRRLRLRAAQEPARHPGAAAVADLRHPGGDRGAQVQPPHRRVQPGGRSSKRLSMRRASATGWRAPRRRRSARTRRPGSSRRASSARACPPG